MEQPNNLDAGSLHVLEQEGGDVEVVRIQWTIKGVDPEVRKLSKRAAKKSGMLVSSWVERTLSQAAQNQLDQGIDSKQNFLELSKRLERMEQQLERRGDGKGISLEEIQVALQRVLGVSEARKSER